MTIQEHPAPRKDPPRVSFSQLDTYHQCGEKYRLKYVERVPTAPSGGLIGGRIVHQVIEEAEREGWWIDDEADAEDLTSPNERAMLDSFDARLTTAIREAGGATAITWGGRGHGEQELWWRAQGGFMLRRYRLTRQQWLAQGIDSVDGGTELRAQAEIAGTQVLGFLDKFLMHDAGEPIIADWKTGRPGNANPIQFATYATLIRLTRGIEVERGLGVFLRAADRERRVQEVRFAGLLPYVERLYGELLRGLDAGYFSAKPNAFCPSCEVRDHCWYAKAVGLARE